MDIQVFTHFAVAQDITDIDYRMCMAYSCEHCLVLICVLVYQRRVLVLLPSDQLPRVLMPNGGVGYVMKLFEESMSENAPKEKDKHMAKLIISNLPTPGSDGVSTMKTMFNYTYKWKDIEMWQGLIESCRYHIKVQGEFGLVRAWRVFSFDQTRARYSHSSDVRL
jgi:hypothetical protein